ncbi:MAG: hypothetical protein NC452_17220 [Eubacterium sp.]|nr:hypothetical protein [Eubacterium sp.]
MLSEDIAGQSMTLATKSAEIALEVARLLKELSKEISTDYLEKKRAKMLDPNADKVDLNSGEVKLSQLRNSGYNVSMQTNIAAHDMEAITAKANEYDIPVSFIGKGENAENVTLAFKTDDKAAVDQILREVMTDKLTVKPDDYLTFQMDNLGEAQTMSALLKENDIPADIVKGADGKYQCLYEAKNAEAVKIIKNDFKETHNKIANNLSIERKGDGFVLTDKLSEKSLTLTSIPTKEQLIKVLRSPKQFGYSDAEAMEAAHKLENTLSGDKLGYFRTNTRQAALLNNFDRNIRLKDDSLLVKPYSFTRTNFASDNVNRYLVSNGEKAVSLIPDQMSRSEMSAAVRYKLGVSDPEAIKAIVDKTEKIEVANKVAEIKREAELSRQNGDIGIERRSEKFFEASQGAVKRSYDLTDKKQSVKALQKDFGISAEKAERIFQKAQNQSTLQNDFHKMAEKTKANAKAKPIKDKKTSKGART